MTPYLLLVALLLFAWLMIRLSRQAGKTGLGLKVVRSLLLLVALIIGLVYCWFRVQRAQADVERSRKAAKEILEVMNRYDAERGVASALATAVGGGEVFDSVEALEAYQEKKRAYKASLRAARAAK